MINVSNKIKKIFAVVFLMTFVLFCFGTPAECAKKSKKNKTIPVEVQTKDEVILQGTLMLPKGASVKNKVPVVLLLHSLGSSKEAYKELSEQIVANNMAALSIDLRGHGQSTTRVSGKRTYWRNYTNSTMAKYPNDIIAVLDYAKTSYFQLNMNKIAIVAADISANAAIIAAGKKKYPIKTLVLLSPSTSFYGLSPSINLVQYGVKPVLLIVSEKDAYHVGQAKELAKYTQGKTIIYILKYGGVGDMMLKTNAETKPYIIKWLKENFIN